NFVLFHTRCICHQSCPASASLSFSCTNAAVCCMRSSSVIILVSSADKFVYFTVGRLIAVLFLYAFVISFVRSPFRISFSCSLRNLLQCNDGTRSLFRPFIQFILQ